MEAGKPRARIEAGNGEIRSFGAVVAVATGLPIAFYNPV